MMHTLQCFSNDVHYSHEWSVRYGNHTETRFCPGRVKAVERTDNANYDGR